MTSTGVLFSYEGMWNDSMACHTLANANVTFCESTPCFKDSWDSIIGIHSFVPTSMFGSNHGIIASPSLGFTSPTTKLMILSLMCHHTPSL